MGVQTSKDTAENEAQGSIPPRANFDHQLNSHSGPTFSPIAPPSFEANPDKSKVIIDLSEYEETVPTVFRWDHGGRNVYITGTFNNWEKQLPMHRSGNDFTYICNLKKGKHAYKFVVDDEWRFAPDQPTVADIEGRINNFLDVTDFSPYVGDDTFFEKCKERKIPDSEFHQYIPDVLEYTKEPPSLPPHLRNIILNKPSAFGDAQALPAPKPVSLNHLYCTAIKDGMMVLGVTERYRNKHVTKVFYSTMPGTSNSLSA